MNKRRAGRKDGRGFIFSGWYHLSYPTVWVLLLCCFRRPTCLVIIVHNWTLEWRNTTFWALRIDGRHIRCWLDNVSLYFSSCSYRVHGPPNEKKKSVKCVDDILFYFGLGERSEWLWNAHTKKKDMKLTLLFFLVMVLFFFHSGAFSNVYKAYDTKMDRMVAVKVVRKFELNAHQVRDKLFCCCWSESFGYSFPRWTVLMSHVDDENGNRVCGYGSGYGSGCGLETRWHPWWNVLFLAFCPCVRGHDRSADETHGEKTRKEKHKEDQDKEKNTESKRIVLTFATNRVWTNYVTPCRLSLLSQRFNSLQNKHLHRDMKKKPRVTEVSITKQPIFVVFDQCSPTYPS